LIRVDRADAAVAMQYLAQPAGRMGADADKTSAAQTHTLGENDT
jgi:hypothetical protein